MENEQSLLEEEVLKEINQLEDLIIVGRESKNYPEISWVLDLLYGHLPINVEYSDIGYKYNREAMKAQISLVGSADSRQSFAQFLDNLRADQRIPEIVSPPSNLLRDQNIDFNLQLILDFKNI